MSIEILGKRLKSLREEKGYYQKFAADKLDIKSNTLSGYENGTRMPDPDMLNKLADFYEVSTDYLLGRTDIKYRFNPEKEYEGFEDFLNDPILNDFLKNDLKNATPAEIEKLRAMYQIIKENE